MRKRTRDYLAFSFQYSEMLSPKVNAYPVFENDQEGIRKLFDCLPPTVIHYGYVSAANKPEAIRRFKETLRTGEVRK